jgi:hypothetical protein
VHGVLAVREPELWQLTGSVHVYDATHAGLGVPHLNDVWALDGLLTRAEPGRSTEHDPLGLSQRILDLYRGPLCAADVDEEWALRPREQLHQRTVRALARLLDEGRATSDWTAMRRLSQRAIHVDDLVEDFHAHYIGARQELGDRSDAVRASSATVKPSSPGSGRSPPSGCARWPGRAEALGSTRPGGISTHL